MLPVGLGCVLMRSGLSDATCYDRRAGPGGDSFGLVVVSTPSVGFFIFVFPIDALFYFASLACLFVGSSVLVRFLSNSSIQDLKMLNFEPSVL